MWVRTSKLSARTPSQRSAAWVSALVIVLGVCHFECCSDVLGQGKAPGKAERDPFASIPFWGNDNPLERFFGRQDPGELDELRKISVTPKEEREYGERVLEAMRQEFKRRGVEVVSRGEQAAYVGKLLEAIKPGMKNHGRYSSLRVLVAQSDETDAYSIPGGTIIVFRGMLEFAESEAALAGVLGHELSHLDRGHQLLPLQRSRALQANSRTRNVASFDQFMRQASQFMSAFMRPFHPEDEVEADRDGATWAYRTNYDPREMARLFARLSERDRLGSFVPSFLRTHPYAGDRQAAIEALYDELHRAEPRSSRDKLYVGRQNLLRRIPMSERKFPE
jgi:predicted Zn-dependent protease